MNEFDIIIAVSFGLNVLFFMLFQRLQTVWSTHGSPNFFLDQVRWAFNRIKNPKIVIGMNSSKFVPIYMVGDNQPVYPDPSNKNTLPLQYDPKCVYHGPKGIPILFAPQGALKNSDPLENANDDIQLQELAQSTLAFIQVEVARGLALNNPFKKLTNLLLLHGVVMLIGFIILAVLLMNIQTVATQVADTIAKYQPVIDNILAHPEKFGLPTNLIGANPDIAPPPPPQQLIPGVI